MRSVLISGAGIAGPVAAFWLNRYGFKTTVVERAPGIRLAGQTVDVRDSARDVIEKMGLAEIVRSRTTKEKGIRFVDEKNRTLAELGAESFGGEGLVSEIEIVRSELANILYEHTKRQTEYIFDDSIRGIDDEKGKVLRVSFQNGKDREFDFVILADGMRSRTRGLVFRNENPFHTLGQYTAYFTIPVEEQDAGWARWYNAPGGRAVMLRPDNQGTTRAYFSFINPPAGFEKLGEARQKSLIIDLFSDAGWESLRMLDHLPQADDFYFEEIGQIKMKKWSKGRVVLWATLATAPRPSAAWEQVLPSSVPTSWRTRWQNTTESLKLSILTKFLCAPSLKRCRSFRRERRGSLRQRLKRAFEFYVRH